MAAELILDQAERRAREVGLHLGPSVADVAAASEAARRRVAGRRYGIVRSVRPVPWPEVPGLFCAVARGPARVPGWRITTPPDGTGVAEDLDVASHAAVAEVVESYCCLAPPDPAGVVRAPFRDLADVAVAPARFAGHSARQQLRFPSLQAFPDTKVVDWIWASSVISGHAALVPAGLVHFSHAIRPPNDFALELVSTGCACHVSLPHAVLSGLCEVIERDALAVAWHNRVPVTPLRIEGTVAEALVTGPLAGWGATFRLLQLPTDAPFPVVLSVAESTGADQPACVVGVACRPDPVAAAVKALHETCQMLSSLGRRRPPFPRSVRTITDHATFYASTRGGELFRRHLPVSGDEQPLDGVVSAQVGTVEEDLRAAGEVLESLGLDVLVCELTTGDVAEAGYRVVRVVVPGMVDISIDPRLAKLGAERLFRLPVDLGLAPRPLPERRLNLLPVPLA